MHPCCSRSLQTGTKVIAIVQLVLAILIITFGILGVVAGRIMFSQELNEIMDSTSKNSDDAKDTGEGTALTKESAVLLVVGIVSVLTSILLFYGAYKRNQKMCMIWFVLTAISLVRSLLTTLKSFREPELALLVGSVFELVLETYFLWVVWAFMTELKQEAEEEPLCANTKPKI